MESDLPNSPRPAAPRRSLQWLALGLKSVLATLVALTLAWIGFAGEMRSQDSTILCGFGPATVLNDEEWEHGWPLIFRERRHFGAGSQPLAAWEGQGNWRGNALAVDLLVFAALLALVIWGARTPWKLPRRFSLASAIAGLTVLCLVIAAAHNTRLAVIRERAIGQQWQEIGYQVNYDYLGPVWLRKLGLSSAATPWLSRLTELKSPDSVRESVKEYYLYPELAELSRLRRLDLRGAGMSDEEFARFARLQTRWQLEELEISDHRFNGGSFAGCRTMPQLRRVNLSRTSLSDAGFASLAQLESLEEIDASGTAVTPEVIPYALQMPNLRKVIFKSTKITAEDCEPLRQKGIVCETNW